MGKWTINSLITLFIENKLKSVPYPIRVKSITEQIISVTAGGDHSIICSKSGKIYSWGNNSKGQLGLGDNRSTLAFTQLKDMEHIRVLEVKAGSQHSACISSSSEVYIWGTEWFGEFVVPHLVKSIKGKWKEIHLGNNFGAVLTEKGDVYVWGNNEEGQLGLGDLTNRPTPSKVSHLKNKPIVSLSWGNSFVIALGETIKVK